MNSSPRRTPLEEEQFLCNEALRTGAFDAISDSAWIEMCERANLRMRHAAENEEVPE